MKSSPKGLYPLISHFRGHVIALTFFHATLHLQQCLNKLLPHPLCCVCPVWAEKHYNTSISNCNTTKTVWNLMVKCSVAGSGYVTHDDLAKKCIEDDATWCWMRGEVKKKPYPDGDLSLHFLHFTQQGRNQGGLSAAHVAHHCQQRALRHHHVNTANTKSSLRRG